MAGKGEGVWLGKKDGGRLEFEKGGDWPASGLVQVL
jgi:hypothetical protein